MSCLLCDLTFHSDCISVHEGQICLLGDLYAFHSVCSSVHEGEMSCTWRPLIISVFALVSKLSNVMSI